MNSKKKILLAFGLAGTMTIGAAGAVFAETGDISVSDKSAYSYNTGKTNHKGLGGERTFIYDESVKADSIIAYLSENADRRLDTEALVEAGIINEETSDTISEYAAQKLGKSLWRTVNHVRGKACLAQILGQVQG